MVIIVVMVWRHYLKNLFNTKNQLHILIKQAEYCLLKSNLTTRFLSSAMFTHSQKTNQLFLTLSSTVVNFSKHGLGLRGNWNLVLHNKLDKDGVQFTQTNYAKNK